MLCSTATVPACRLCPTYNPALLYLQAKLEDMGEESCGQVATPSVPLTKAQRRELGSVRTWLLARQQDEVGAGAAD